MSDSLFGSPYARHETASVSGQNDCAFRLIDQPADLCIEMEVSRAGVGRAAILVSEGNAITELCIQLSGPQHRPVSDSLTRVLSFSGVVVGSVGNAIRQIV